MSKDNFREKFTDNINCIFFRFVEPKNVRVYFQKIDSFKTKYPQFADFVEGDDRNFTLTQDVHGDGEALTEEEIKLISAYITEEINS